MTPFRLWVYLQTTPLFWLTATLAAYIVADRIALAAGRHPVVNPVAIAIALLGALLKLTGTDYQTYFNGAQFVHFLLGPATVALAVPLYRNLELVKRNLLPMAASLAVGAFVAIARRCIVARALGAPRAGAGVARAEVSDGRRGDGRVGDARRRSAADRGAGHRDRDFGRDRRHADDGRAENPRLRRARLRRGSRLAGIGTARAFAVDPVAGVFAGIAMGLNAVATPAIIPVLLPWLTG